MDGQPDRQSRSIGTEDHDHHELRHGSSAQVGLGYRFSSPRKRSSVVKNSGNETPTHSAVPNHRIAFRAERRDRERHRDAMIALRIDFRASQFSRRAAPRPPRACRPEIPPRCAPIRPQSFRERRDAIAFLHAQFLRVVDFDSLLRERAERRQHRQFVDHLRHLRAANTAAFERRMAARRHRPLILRCATAPTPA